MKTSFYFVLWIVIYPILGLLNNSFIDNNAFIVALVAVWGLSWLLNRMMPDTLTYERATQIAPVLEDVYTGNVTAFRKRLSREANIETVTAVYFIITLVVIAISIFKFGGNDWIALVIFGLFTYGAVSRSVSLVGAKSRLKSDPTAEQCREIAEDTYDLDYSTYYEAHYGVTYKEILPPKPKHFKVFKIFSTAFAAISALLGLLYIVLGVMIMFSEANLNTDAIAVAGMYFLYGSLAAYYGVKDFVSIMQSFNHK